MPSVPPSSTDPDLESLPEPRRPFRRLTLATMSFTLIASLGAAAALLPSARFALGDRAPADVGAQPLGESLNNRWVHVRGAVETGAIEYRRPLDADYFRLARMGDRPELWVEVRIPADLDKAHYVPPTSFVGRLLKADGAGMRHAEIPKVVARITGRELPKDAWLLIDGESPRGTLWVVAVLALLIGFAAFNLWGVVHLSRPVRDA